MKFLLLIATISTFLIGFDNKKQFNNSNKLECRLTSDKKIYKIGEVPKLNVEIINKSDSAIYLIGSLDGSDIRERMPYCYFTIQKPKADTILQMRCGNQNPLRTEDFRWINKAEKFNPYQHVDEYGFFWEALANNKKSYKNLGLYKIKFYYSSKSKKIEDYMGDPIERTSADSIKICNLFQQLSKVELVSNEIEIRFQK